MDIRETRNLASDPRRHFWEIARLHFIKKLLLRYCREAGFLTDIGCGDCFILQSLSKILPRTRFTGIDTALTEESIAQLKQRFAGKENISLHTGSNNEAIPPADVVLLCDVLEHVENEQEFLLHIKELMKSDSTMIVTVPAFQRLFTEHDRFLHHFRRYNRKQLCRVLKAAGFKIEFSGYIFFSLLPLRIIQKILHIPAAKENSLRPGNRFFNALAALILKIDTGISFLFSRIKLPLPGLSCFAVIRKENLPPPDSRQ